MPLEEQQCLVKHRCLLLGRLSEIPGIASGQKASSLEVSRVTVTQVSLCATCGTLCVHKQHTAFFTLRTLQAGVGLHRSTCMHTCVIT